jgi:hypothetical protein
MLKGCAAVIVFSRMTGRGYQGKPPALFGSMHYFEQGLAAAQQAITTGL